MITGYDLRRFRQRHALSIRKIAILLRVHPVSVYNWERGRHQIARRHQLRIAMLFLEAARRQPHPPTTAVCSQCQGTGLQPAAVEVPT